METYLGNKFNVLRVGHMAFVQEAVTLEAACRSLPDKHAPAYNGDGLRFYSKKSLIERSGFILIFVLNEK